jgi:hypothetical protein
LLGLKRDRENLQSVINVRECYQDFVVNVFSDIRMINITSHKKEEPKKDDEEQNEKTSLLFRKS